MARCSVIIRGGPGGRARARKPNPRRTPMAAHDQDKELVERLIAETNLSARMDALIGEICDKLREYGVSSPHKAFNDLVDPFREYFMLEYEEERGLEESEEEEEEKEGEGGRNYGPLVRLLCESPRSTPASRLLVPFLAHDVVSGGPPRACSTREM